MISTLKAEQEINYKEVIESYRTYIGRAMMALLPKKEGNNLTQITNISGEIHCSIHFFLNSHDELQEKSEASLDLQKEKTSFQEITKKFNDFKKLENEFVLDQKKNSFKEKLTEYISTRTVEEEKKQRSPFRFFSKIFSGRFNAKAKVSAATKLISCFENNSQELTDFDVDALRDSKLGKIVAKYKDVWPDKFKNKVIKKDLATRKLKVYQ